MTDLKSVEYSLREYGLAEARISILKAESARLRAIMNDAQNMLNSVDKSEAIDSLFADAEKLSAVLLDEIRSIIEHCKKVKAMIDSLENPDVRTVLECRYYGKEKMPFAKIATKLHMSETKVKTLCKSGLTILKERYG